MAKIVIIGAGLTGLSTAYHFEKKGFSDFSIFEKESEIGGLCRSVQQDGFTFDYTGHLLHTSDTYFRKIIEELVGIENLHTITRRSFIYSHDTFTPYPFQINLQGLPTKVIAECIEGFIKRKKIKKQKTHSCNGYNPILVMVLANIFFTPINKKFSPIICKKSLPAGPVDLSHKRP